ncbi:MAG TPA: hypothetical protein VGK17_15065 [Propionicimonas sp.]|jgi:hypothetical protein
MTAAGRSSAEADLPSSLLRSLVVVIVTLPAAGRGRPVVLLSPW